MQIRGRRYKRRGSLVVYFLFILQIYLLVFPLLFPSLFFVLEYDYIIFINRTIVHKKIRSCNSFF
jgi:hypothetical protein